MEATDPSSAEGVPSAAALERRKMNIYKTLMRRAAIGDRKKHLVHLVDPHGSEREPRGVVSKQIYSGIYGGRKFDQYNRLVSTKLSEKERMIADLQKSLSGGGSSAAVSSPSKRGEEVVKLRTAKATIGYKADLFGPPGLAPPRTGVLNSEGNEQFYSYDGHWKDGRMHGFGRYKFADGMLYVGHFREGKPHGDGRSEYPGGTSYEGEWRAGRHEGKGEMRYGSGSVYVGHWKEGKRQGGGVLTFDDGTVYDGMFWLGKYHGRGQLASKRTGFTFSGTFHRGFVNGPGSLLCPDGSRDTRNWVALGGMTLKQIVEYSNREKAEKAAIATAQRDGAFGLRLAIRLQDYVADVKADIAEKREASKADAEVVRRALVQDRKDKAKRAREDALEQLANAADVNLGIEAEDRTPEPTDALQNI